MYGRGHDGSMTHPPTGVVRWKFNCFFRWAVLIVGFLRHPSVLYVGFHFHFGSLLLSSFPVINYGY